MDLNERIRVLSRFRSALTPVVSVYLDCRWTDEHQRERVRISLKTHVSDARERSLASAEDLDWISERVEALVNQAEYPDARGVALFACAASGLREMVPLRVAVDEAFVVADAPYVRPLVALATPPALVVFVDAQTARLIPLDAQRIGEEVGLTANVMGHHRRGGWAMMLQSRYQRHIQEQRSRHLDAVADAVAHAVAADGVERIVIAGEARNVSLFAQRLPQHVGHRVAGTMPASRDEPAARLVERALALIAAKERDEDAAGIAAVLVTAAKAGAAAAGIEATLAALARGAVDRLYVLEGFREPGAACVRCSALMHGPNPTCVTCGGVTKEVELGEAIVAEVIATGGTVEIVHRDDGLARAGGIAARLRYPL